LDRNQVSHFNLWGGVKKGDDFKTVSCLGQGVPVRKGVGDSVKKLTQMMNDHHVKCSDNTRSETVGFRKKIEIDVPSWVIRINHLGAPQVVVLFRLQHDIGDLVSLGVSVEKCQVACSVRVPSREVVVDHVGVAPIIQKP